MLLQRYHERGGGHHRDHGGGHLQVSPGALLRGERRQTHRQGAEGGVVDGDNQRPQVGVPEAQEGEHGQHRDRGTRQRQNNVEVDAQRPRTVDPGGLVQLEGNAPVELAQQEGTESAERERNDQNLIAVELRDRKSVV